jgi:hypothetical protein
VEQLAASPVKTVFFVLIMLSIVLAYIFWFDRKPVEFKRAQHKRVSGIFILAVCGTTYLFFPSDRNMVLLLLGAVLLYLVNTRLVHYCPVCGKTIRTNMIKQVPEKCPYCHSLYTPPGKYPG